MTKSGLEKFMQWFQQANPQAAKSMQQNLTQNQPGMQNQMGGMQGIDGAPNPQMMAMMNNPQMMQEMQQRQQEAQRRQQAINGSMLDMGDGAYMKQSPAMMQQMQQRMQQMQPLQQAISGMRGQDGAPNPEMMAMRGNPQMMQEMQRRQQPPMGIQDGGDMAGLLRNRSGNVKNMMQFGEMG